MSTTDEQSADASADTQDSTERLTRPGTQSGTQAQAPRDGALARTVPRRNLSGAAARAAAMTKMGSKGRASPPSDAARTIQSAGGDPTGPAAEPSGGQTSRYEPFRAGSSSTNSDSRPNRRPARPASAREGQLAGAAAVGAAAAQAARTTTTAPAKPSGGTITSGRPAAREGSAARTGGQRAQRATDRSGRPVRRSGPRRVRLTLQRVDPWSVLKISLLVSVALGIAGVVMVAVLWSVLSGMDVFTTVNNLIVEITTGESTASTFDIMDYVGFGRVLALATVLAVANVLLLTALATLTAFLYNVCTALVGGAQMTLSDE